MAAGRVTGPARLSLQPGTAQDLHVVRLALGDRRIGVEEHVAGLTKWADHLAGIATPRKADQDRLDAVLCALIALHWHTASRAASIMIGDRTAGYMIAPATREVRARLESAAFRAGVPIDLEAEDTR